VTIRVMTVISHKDGDRYELEIATDRSMTTVNITKEELVLLRKSINDKI